MTARNEFEDTNKCPGIGKLRAYLGKPNNPAWLVDDGKHWKGGLEMDYERS